MFWQTPSIGIHCTIKSTQNVDQYRNLTVQDANQDTIWTAFLGLPGVDQGGLEMDFNRAAWTWTSNRGSC